MRQKSSPPENLVRATRQGHPPCDAQAILGRREDPHRPRRPARRRLDRRALPPRRHRREPLLQLVEGIPRSRQATAGRRHRACGDHRARSRTSAPGPGAEGGRRRAGARTAAAQKKHDRGWGRRGMRYPALREARDHPPRRAVASAGPQNAGEARHPRRRSIAGTIAIEPAALKRSTTSRRSRPESGTASPTMCASASSRWRSMSPSCRRASWRCASPIRRSTSSRKPPSIGCSRRTT